MATRLAFVRIISTRLRADYRFPPIPAGEDTQGRGVPYCEVLRSRRRNLVRTAYFSINSPRTPRLFNFKKRVFASKLPSPQILQKSVQPSVSSPACNAAATRYNTFVCHCRGKLQSSPKQTSTTHTHTHHTYTHVYCNRSPSVLPSCGHKHASATSYTRVCCNRSPSIRPSCGHKHVSATHTHTPMSARKEVPLSYHSMAISMCLDSSNSVHFSYMFLRPFKVLWLRNFCFREKKC
jgi:hypothetical protein